VDCSTASHGCNGGWFTKSFAYLQSNYAILGSNYGYTGRNGTCKYSSSTKSSVKVKSYKNVTSQSSSALKSAIAVTPTSVSVAADSSVFGNYKSGVITGSKCGTSTDHAVLAVGYGTENGTPYYLVKNSWGKSWGASGYVKIGIESGKGVCGI